MYEYSLERHTSLSIIFILDIYIPWNMINTVVDAIEEFEASVASVASDESQLPLSIFENGIDDDYNVDVETEDDTSDSSDEYKDALESSSSDDTKIPVSPQQFIKQTLKDKIRFRRESENAGELTNLFQPPRQYKVYIFINDLQHITKYHLKYEI